jgi:long-chain acyl-CoA synthetase
LVIEMPPPSLLEPQRKGMAETLPGLFLEAVPEYKKRPLFLTKRGAAWVPISAPDALAHVEDLALGFRDLGVQPGDRVALLSENRYEWPIVDLALLGLGAVTVPIYPSLTAEQCRFVLEGSEAKLVVVSDGEQLSKVHKASDHLRGLHSYVYMDSRGAVHPDDRPLSAVREWGAQKRQHSPHAFLDSVNKIQGNDLATIIYTSGTTGEPKGAALTHSNIISNVDSGMKILRVSKKDTSLSFLPLCHIFERMAGLYAMMAGGVTIAYAENLAKVAENMEEVRPTVITGVPRFFEKAYQRVLQSGLEKPAPLRALFKWSVGRSVKKARRRLAHQPVGFWEMVSAGVGDVIVGSKVRAKMGGRLRYCIAGGAPLAPEIMEFFMGMGIPVIEGYGLTETSPVICLNPLDKPKPGSVGPPIPGVEVRIAENGEILTRGPHVMSGYYNDDEATSAVIRDGWFHTGDVGWQDDEGYLYITDRLKEILITAGGKKVTPQPIETQLKSIKWVSEAVLIGDTMPYVVCLLVPDFAQLETEAAKKGWEFSSRSELIKLPEVLGIYETALRRLNENLARFEQIKRFALLERELTQESSELTPTLKIRRRVIRERYADIIDELYRGHLPPEI